MTIGQHIEEFHGLPVEQFQPGMSLRSNVAYRLSLDWEESEAGKTFTDLFAALLAADPQSLAALIVGDWGEAGTGNDSAPVVEALVSACDQLTGLKALFLGEMVCEESEISWILQSDISPLFGAFPNLENLSIRGGNGLGLGRPKHARLKTLVIETGGLRADVIHELASADLPALEHLELWLGDPNYGNDITNADLEPIVSGRLFSSLQYLGLRDDANADETAELLARAPILERLQTLDISLGTLSDRGAEVLLAVPSIRRLKRLDLHFHYVSPETVAKLKQLGPDVDADDPQEPHKYGDEENRYVSVSE